MAVESAWKVSEGCLGVSGGCLEVSERCLGGVMGGSKDLWTHKTQNIASIITQRFFSQCSQITKITCNSQNLQTPCTGGQTNFLAKTKNFPWF